MSYDIERLSLTACSGLCGSLCTQPQATSWPSPSTAPPKDAHVYTTFASIRIYALVLWSYQTLLLLTYPSPPNSAVPLPRQPRSFAFAWTPSTTAALLIILLAAPIRILAFHQLGANFTFHLAKPRGLVTTGLYAYVQHPSYTANWLVYYANFALLLRLNSSSSC